MAASLAGCCCSCGYFDRQPEGKGWGWCCRYPPPPGERHLIYDSEGCGEWAPENPETFTDAAATLARFVLLGDRTSVYALVDKLKEERSGE